MDSATQASERFRKGFVLAMTLIYTTLFFTMLWGFAQALLMAAVFSGILYPLYRRLQARFNGRANRAALATLGIAVLGIIIPLIFLIGLIAQQALEVTEAVQPLIEQQLDPSAESMNELPGWFPFADQLEPYAEEISAKLGELASGIASFLVGGLARVTEGTMVFFLNLFVMLYAIYVFLINGPQLIRTIMGYFPLSQADKDKMLQVGLSVSRATVKGTMIIGIIQGTLGGLAFAVAGIGSAVFWAAVMAVLSVLPGIGAALIWAPAVVYLLMTGHTVEGLGLLAWCAGVVSTIDNVLRPILVGRDTEMPDLLILLATLGGLGMFGATGLVLGPILAALFLTVLAIYSRVFADWLGANNEDETDEQLDRRP